VFVAAFDPADVAPAVPSEVPSEVADPFAVLVAALPVGVAYVAPGGAVDYVNDEWLAATGIGYGDAFLDEIAALDRESGLAGALKTGSTWTGRVRLDGGDAELRVVPIAEADGGGALVALTRVGMAAERSDAHGDVTSELSRLVGPVARLVDIAPDYAGILTPDGTVLHLNEAARRAIGIADDAQVVGVPAAELVRFIDGSTADGEIDIDRLFREGSLLTSGEMRYGDLGAAGLPVALMLYVIADADGAAAAILAVARDRSDVHAARQQIATSEATVNAIVEPAPVAIFTVDRNGDVAIWNEACVALFGWPHDEVVGRPPPFLPDDFDPVTLRLADRLGAGEVIRGRSRFRRRDGAPIYAELASAPVFAVDGTLSTVVTVAVDTTRAEQAAAELEYRAGVDQLVASIARSLVDATAVTVEDRVTDVLRMVAARSGAAGARLGLHGEPEARFVWPNGSARDVEAGDGIGAFCSATVDGREFRAGWVLAGGAGRLGTLELRWPDDPDVELADLESLEMITTALVAAV
jgi:PAS domain S-box-containing protein